MKPLTQFKQELGIAQINFSKSVKTGRQFATVSKLTDNGVKVDYNIVVSKSFDKAKPAYVTYVSEFEGVKRDLHVICNAQGIAEGDTL